MAQTLAPKLEGQASFEQSVSAVPNAALGTAQALTGFLAGMGSPKAPSAASAKGESLRPYVQTMTNIANSDLSEHEKLTAQRAAMTTVLVDFPQFSSDIQGIASDSFGVDIAVRPDDPSDTIVTQLNEWAKTVEGQNAYIGSLVFKDGGELDHEATGQKYRASHASYLADVANLAVAKRELETLETGSKIHQEKSAQAYEDILPTWTAKSTAITNSVAYSAASGDPEFDTPEEIMGFLRDQRASMLAEYRTQAQSNSFHSDYYSDEALARGLAPFEDLITLFKDDATDIGAINLAFKNAAEYKSMKFLTANLGVLAGNPEFLRSVFSTLSSEFYNKEAFEAAVQAATHSAGQENWTGSDILLPRIFRPIQEVVTAPVVDPNRVDALRNAENEAPGTIDKQVVGTAQMLGTAPDAPSAFRALADLTTSAAAADTPLSMDYLKDIFNYTTLGKMGEYSKSGDQDSAAILATAASLAADQIKRNMVVIQGFPSGPVGYQVVETNGILSIMIGGEEADRSTFLTGAPTFLKDMQAAVDNINYINMSMKRLGNLAEVTTNVTRSELLTNSEMNPLIGSLEGASRLTKPYAASRMASVVAGPLAQMQGILGYNVTINDAIAKAGTSREKNTKGSRHFHGDAMDISLAGMNDAQRMEVVQAALDSGFQGFGFGKNILHIDLGNARSWAYGNSTFAGRSISDMKALVNGGVLPPAELPLSDHPESAPSGGSLGDMGVLESDEGEGPNSDFSFMGDVAGTPSAEITPEGEATSTAATTATPKGASKVVARSLGERAVTLLKEHHVSPDTELLSFATGDAAEAAIKRGEVKEGDIILIDGELLVYGE